MRQFFVDGKPPILRFTTPDHFIANGMPVIDRFADVWGKSDNCYLQYSIEDIKTPSKQTQRKQKKLFKFIRKLCYSNKKHILDEALTVISVEELGEWAVQKGQQRRKIVDVDYINKKTLLP